jgi:L-glutamine:2-deoxy-scyllo-inosose/3-amino-2,3-dideoxy-scyllo-inosose aminotransferase
VTARLAINGGEPVRSRPFPTWPVTTERELELITGVVASGVWSGNGPMEREFADRFAQLCGATRAVCVSNGTVALDIALRGLGVGPNDEVIVPALTWIATAWAVVQVGAVPVFADVGERDWCLDPDSVSERITPRTRAIIPVHLYHQIAQMDRLLEIARDASLFVVEDCAHVVGARWRDQGVGTLGQVGTFSFQASKGLTAGEGGALVTNDEALAKRIYALKDCGRPMLESQSPGFGGNYRITELQAALLLAQLERLGAQLATKAANVEALEERLRDIEGIAVLPRKEDVTRTSMYALGLAYDADAFGGLPRKILLRALCAEGIPVDVPYPVVHRSPLWRSGARFIEWEPGSDPGQRLGLDASCPVAESISDASGLILFHQVFLGDQSDMADIAQAFAKIQANSSELRFKSLDQKARDRTREMVRRLGKDF